MDKKILISCGVSSREWILPYYLRHIYNINYDKKLIDIYWIVNNSNDKSLDLLHQFKKQYENEYNSICIEIYNNSEIPAEERSTEIREKYIYAWLSLIRNKILKKTIKLKCDYLLSCDSDILVTSDILNRLLSHNVPIVATLIYNGYETNDFNDAYKNPNILRELDYRRYKYIVNHRIKHPEKQEIGKLIKCEYTGACILIAQEVCKKAQYAYSNQGEDEPFCFSARCAGFSLFADISLFQHHCMSKNVLEYFIKNKFVEEINEENKVI